MGRSQHWPVWIWICLAASLPILIVTLRWEAILTRRGGQPMLDVSLFRNTVFVRGLIVCLGTFCSFFSLVFALTLVLQSGLGLTPLRAGFTFAPLGVAFALASITSPRIVGRFGARLVATGTGIAAVGMLSLLIVVQMSGGATSAARLIGPMVVIGLGNGLAVPALTGVVLAGARTANAGAAAGVLTTTQQFSSAVGVAGIGTIFFAALGSSHSVSGNASALTWVAAVDLGLALLSCGASVLLARRPATA